MDLSGKGAGNLAQASIVWPAPSTTSYGPPYRLVTGYPLASCTARYFLPCTLIEEKRLCGEEIRHHVRIGPACQDHRFLGVVDVLPTNGGRIAAPDDFRQDDVDAADFVFVPGQCRPGWLESDAPSR